jgi:hypothetical protein
MSRDLSPPFDEYGLPQAWRRPASETRAFGRNVGAGWERFEAWCIHHGEKAFPADERTVLRFLLHPDGIIGNDLGESWQAIRQHHGAYYWRTDANPVELLFLDGVRVSEDGEVTAPPESVELILDNGPGSDERR